MVRCSNLVIELGLKLEPDLLRLLLTHERIKQHFFCRAECPFRPFSPTY